LKIHFEKLQDRHIPEMVLPITAKLGKVIHIVILTVLTVKILKFLNPRWWRSPFWQKNWKTASLTDIHHPTLLILSNKTANIIKRNWNQFLLVVKATALKQQISDFYPQILSTKASFYIYHRPMTGINVIASVCAFNLRIKKLIFAVLERWLLQLRETDSSFVL